MNSWVGELAGCLRASVGFVDCAAVVIRALEQAGHPGVAVIACDGRASPMVWTSNGYFTAEHARSFLDGGDPLFASMRDTLATVHDDRRWFVPILGCGELLGALHVVAGNLGVDGNIALAGALLSVRLAALGLDTSLADRVGPVLTERQHEVAYLVARGCTNPEIARMLAISTNAVKKHLSRIFTITGTSNRSELAAYAGRWPAAAPPAAQQLLVETALGTRASSLQHAA